MINYNNIFTNNNIYEYPFSSKIKKFFILGWTNINILKKIDFNILISYLKSNKIKEVTIVIENDKKILLLKDFKYLTYENLTLGKGNHTIFWGKEEGIAMSEEFFGLVGGGDDFLNFFILGIGLKNLKKRYFQFKEEWIDGNDIGWASKLLERENIIKFE